MNKEILTRIIVEILGFPKDHVETTLKAVVEKLKTEEGVKVLKEAIENAEEVKDFWSAFAEIEMKTENIQRLMDICFDYMPSSIEILEPNEVGMDINNLSNFFNDLLARLHQYDMLLKNVHAENFLLKKKLGIEDKEDLSTK